MYVPYFEGADFKSDIYFRKLRVQILKFEHLGPKNIIFFNLNEILPARYFKGADFKSDICFRWFLAASTQVTRTNSMSPLYKLFGKRFFYFWQKSQNAMTPIIIFLTL